MPYGEYAECPCCKKIAKGKEEIEEKFGYRNMGEDKIIPQSYCRKCRSAHCEVGNPKH
jgi:hypothetical protein